MVKIPAGDEIKRAANDKVTVIYNSRRRFVKYLLFHIEESFLFHEQVFIGKGRALNPPILLDVVMSAGLLGNVGVDERKFKSWKQAK
jgi:hypothetical protein